MKKILCLNPHWNDSIKSESISFINEINPAFLSLSTIKQLNWLCRNARDYNTVVFYRNYHLAVMYGLFSIIRKQSLILHEFYLPNRIGCLKQKYFKLLLSLMDKTIVHSSFETKYLAKKFNISESRFAFIRYFYYDHFEEPSDIPHSKLKVVVPGRHRDLNILNEIQRFDNLDFVVVGGKDDSIPFRHDNVEAKYEVSKDDYDKIFASADLILIPLSKEYNRSLGQIALMKAYVLRKPLIVSPLPIIEDYIHPDACIEYTPGNAESLNEAIRKYLSLNDSEKRRMLDAGQNFVKNFSRRNYAEQFKQVMLSL
ncbi:MAG: glycosyltransferase [Alistipes sp.]|nr:glycosyltransferase [Alistipes sp.]